ncbi:MAG: transposase [Anaerolineae bacterium]|nr:MAG: transposase [Anaerolineae bacterium]
MPNFRRYYVPNAIYFIVAVTKDRRPVFADAADVDLLFDVLRQVRQRKPFRLLAYSIIPDHINLLLRPTGEGNISRIMLSIKRSFTLRFKELNHVTGSLNLWQARFWDHIIRDEKDLHRHFDYIHYNPVKHGLVTRPEDYPHSSYRHWLEKGYYEPGWGHVEPQSVKDMDFE